MIVYSMNNGCAFTDLPLVSLIWWGTCIDMNYVTPCLSIYILVCIWVSVHTIFLLGFLNLVPKQSKEMEFFIPDCSRSNFKHMGQIIFLILPCSLFTFYKWIIMLEKCRRPDLTVFHLIWIIGIYGNWKNQNPGGRFGATS